MYRISVMTLAVASSVLMIPDAEGQQFATVADVVLASGDGFDSNPGDFDVLLAAADQAGLVGALSDPRAELTVFAPNDAAFILFARDLGYTGFDEAGAWSFIQTNAGSLLSTVLLYHVIGEELTVFDFFLASLFGQSIETLQGGSIDPNFVSIGDNDPNARDPYLFAPLNVQTGNGIVHTISGVLRPIDL